MSEHKYEPGDKLWYSLGRCWVTIAATLSLGYDVPGYNVKDVYGSQLVVRESDLDDAWGTA